MRSLKEFYTNWISIDPGSFGKVITTKRNID
jgi:hypothetical protein